MTFRELQDDALEACGYAPGTVDAAVRARFKRNLNFWHRRILVRPQFVRLLRDTTNWTFSSVASQALYAFRAPIGRLNGLHDRTNRIKLGQRSLAWLRDTDPDLSFVGDPATDYIVHGWAPVGVQPSNASDLYWISTSASDTAITGYLEYISSTGTRVTRAVTLTGTTGVLGSLSGATALVVTKAYLSAKPVGTVTLREDSGTGTVMATINPAGTEVDLSAGIAARYLIVQLWPTPQSVITYYADFSRELEDMTADRDIPILPPDFHWLLSLGAQAEEWRRKDDTREENCRVLLEDGLRSLNGWLWDTADQDYGRGGSRGRSQLGSWFEAGT